MIDSPPSSPSPKSKSALGPAARRMLILFVCCAALPTTWFAWVAEKSVAEELIVEADRHLAASAKWEAVQIFERLTDLTERIDEQLRSSSTRPRSALEFLAPFQTFRGSCSRLALVDLRSGRVLSGDPIEPLTLSDREHTHFSSGRPVLQRTDDVTPESSGFRLVFPAGPGRALVAGLREEGVWGPQAVQISRHRIDIFDGSGGLNESALLDNLEVGQVLGWGTNDLEAFEWTLADSQYRGSSYTLPLEFSFGTSPWTVVASETIDQILAPIEGFQSRFLRLVLMTTLVVSFLGLRMIRRQVRPLSIIVEGTRKIASGELDTRIGIDRKDEYGALARDFNAMADRLERQFKENMTIRAMTEEILAAPAVDDVVSRILHHLPKLLPDASLEVILDSPIGVEMHWCPILEDGATTTTKLVTFTDEQHASLKQTEALWIEVSENFAWLEKVVRRVDAEAPAWVFPMRATGAFLGAVIVVEHLTPEQCRFVRQIADQGAIALANTKRVSSLESMSWETLCLLARTVDARSDWSNGHADRVAFASRKLAEVAGLSPAQIEQVYRSALVHDVGKVEIEDEIINKPAPLDAQEYERLKDHIDIGCRILGASTTYQELMPIVRGQSERFDGHGYPDGLSGTAIPIGARILAIADAYDAMTCDRPYRTGYSQEEATRRIAKGSGSQFDPDLVATLLGLIARDPNALEIQSGEVHV